MVVEANFYEVYLNQGYEQRINMILKNYTSFPRMIDGFEEELCDTIIEERAYNRRTEMGDLGVRVQTSGHSDPTFKAAMNHLTTLEIIRKEDLRSGALAGTDEVEKHIMEIRVLNMMRNDYKSVVRAIGATLDDDERDELELTLKRKGQIAMISEERGIEVDSVRKRLKRSRLKVRKQAIVYMEKRYKENSLIWDTEEKQ